ncbi:MAG: hypothetical protein KME16_20790 [Scytolyngbya sp. HA4215-MV1]|jgi:hypothetical protein|nr:hypothetical protein [Scytolyngbya sp. HA4215-MV1]
MKPRLIENGRCPADLEQSIVTWLEDLHRSDETFYQMMSLELWSIAQTMDEVIPGFWGKYMHNRQTIVQQHIRERQNRSVQTSKRSEGTIQLRSSPRHKSRRSLWGVAE